MLEIILKSLLWSAYRSINEPEFKLNLFVVWLKFVASLESLNRLENIANAHAGHSEDVICLNVT